MFRNFDSVLNDHWFGLQRGHVDDCHCITVDTACIECRDSFAWLDDTPMLLDGWANAIEPGSRDCACITGSGWADELCETELQFFCERGGYW